MSKFFSCDWGVSNFRLRLVDTVTRKLYGEVLSGTGIAETHQQWLASERPEAERIGFYKSKISQAIRKMSDADQDMPIILSGMASSSIGLAELTYQKFPFTRNLSEWVIQKIDGDEKFSNPLFLVSGFKTDEDVMRGEETILLGCDIEDDGEKIFIFPGSHSKHVFVKNKTGINFKTYMTGEVFSLMSEKSVLSNVVQTGKEDESFAEGFSAGLSGNILHNLFTVRTRFLLQNKTKLSNYQWLSGLMIGTELKDIKEKTVPVYLVSGEKLRNPYLRALELLGFKGRIFDLNADDMLIKGHCHIAAHYL